MHCLLLTLLIAVAALPPRMIDIVDRRRTLSQHQSTFAEQ